MDATFRGSFFCRFGISILWEFVSIQLILVRISGYMIGEHVTVYI